MKVLAACNVALCAAVLWACFTAEVRGQAIHGAIVGTVNDPSGAAVPNATAIITNEGMNFQRTVTTEASGDYRVSGLEAGSYTVAVNAQGFKKFQQTKVALTLGRNKRVDAGLEVVEATTTVTVEGGTSQIETEAPTLSSLKSSRDFTQLPLSILGRGWNSVMNCRRECPKGVARARAPG